MATVGVVVKVKVLEVAEKRKRVALTMRLNETPSAREKIQYMMSSIGAASRHKTAGNPRQLGSSPPGAAGGALAAAFAKLKAGN